MYTLINGNELSRTMRAEMAEEAAQFTESRGRQIGLAVILAGEDSASKVYVRNKIRACEQVGIRSFSYYLPEDVAEKDMEELVQSLVDNDEVDGILVQLPMPKHLDSEKILKLIPAEKDVDGFSVSNMGKLALKQDCLVACTPNGVMQMLKRNGIDPKGKCATVVGRSNIVGKPMAMLLLNADATVTVCHSKTPDLKEKCLGADILVAAIGKPKFITADMVKEGAVVIDVGMDRDENGKLCGDVDFENVKDKCSYITPVPGGVGPMTITMLMYNTIEAAKARTRSI
ncbi:MAG: bifunctional methylenetetrahydrofolate dehydrogenase/methenyltetrahydrofolate cyclohydrolase FolD [Clostridia bacterium]|nr:bifunctional methylenetetrahydrofolate dehydrogenase/methenyltetrahydrofolate cyclohydrolase FolD [Clostridia bacterium]